MKAGFIREVYLRSTPSIDLNLLAEGEKADCTKHTLKCSEYDKLLDEFCENSDERFACNMFMLQSGPQLVED